MPKRTLAAPDDQRVAFVELFFDLVFVFAVTQISHYAAYHLDAWHLFSTVVVFWMIWWAWTQFTWALNAADTERHEIRVGTLASTGVAFVMAVSIRGAFAEDAPWFAGSYVLLRLLGLGLYHRVAADDPIQQRGVRSFAVGSIPGLVLVLVGALVPAWFRPWVWLGVIVLDVAAAVVAGRHAGWKLQAGHFAERHGLIVIIALGESLIIAGTGVQMEGRGAGLLLDGVLGVAATCLLWWTYFGWIKDALELRLHAVTAEREEAMARDTYSLLHFPLVVGVVAYAVGLERLASADGGDVEPRVAGALALGVGLLLGSTAAALRRAAGFWLWPRLLICAATGAAVLAIAPAPAPLVLGILCFGLTLVISLERVRCDRARARGEADATPGGGDAESA